MQSNRPHIVIADDHTFMADACKKLLEPKYDVVATVGDGRALVRIAATLKPQVIIIDIGMPLLNGLDAGYQVKQLLPSVKLVFLTMNTDPVLAAEAFCRGASAYLVKTCAASELIAAVREVLKGMSYLSPAIAKETAIPSTSSISIVSIRKFRSKTLREWSRSSFRKERSNTSAFRKRVRRAFVVRMPYSLSPRSKANLRCGGESLSRRSFRRLRNSVSALFLIVRLGRAT
jgi:DNA-binding NarL/FixJ family response regulator